MFIIISWKFLDLGGTEFWAFLQKLMPCHLQSVFHSFSTTYFVDIASRSFASPGFHYLNMHKLLCIVPQRSSIYSGKVSYSKVQRSNGVGKIYMHSCCSFSLSWMFDPTKKQCPSFWNRNFSGPILQTFTLFFYMNQKISSEARYS